jgi:hypothetical protein
VRRVRVTVPGAVGNLDESTTHVADELAVDAEHAHAVVVALGDGDVTVVRHDAQSSRRVHLSVVGAERPEPTKKSAVGAVEHSDAVSLVL